MPVFPGQVTLELKGIGALPFLNAVHQAGYGIRTLQKTGPQAFRFQCSTRTLFLLRPLAQGYAIHLRILQKSGLYAVLHKLSLRPFLLLGAVAALLIYLWCFSWVWQVRFVGETEGVEELVRIWLTEKNLHPGCAKRGMDLQSLSETLLRDFPALSFAQLTLRGVTLEAEIYQTVPPAQLPQVGVSVPLLADRNGTVTTLHVLKGTPAVQVGDEVRKGDVLIYGSTPLTGQPVQAEGEVILTTCLEQTVGLPLYTEKEMPTGRRYLKKKLLLHNIPIVSTQSGEKVLDGKDSRLRSGRLTLSALVPLTYAWESREEVETVREKKSVEEVAFLAQSRAHYLLYRALPPDCVVVDKWVEMDIINDEKVCCRVILQVAAKVENRQ